MISKHKVRKLGNGKLHFYGDSKTDYINEQHFDFRYHEKNKNYAISITIRFQKNEILITSSFNDNQKLEDKKIEKDLKLKRDFLVEEIKKIIKEDPKYRLLVLTGVVILN